MDTLQRFLLRCALALILTGASCKHIDHRNLFTQRMCCKRQSHFVYIGQGQQEYSKHSSMLEFLRSKKVGGRSKVDREGAP
ncbi:unnamed protein product [Tetraodon nigroviridis]|uniref:(spotted green pufferfish) hypothetical protein n=1 Tax=Tetraodon nigroviridis TaxID=99883 RepID=Q4RWR3_TETNG|nr:unnamed protein product [Tetraodon nigroviridis]